MGYAPLLGGLESAVLAACGGEEEWPAQIAAGVYAGVDYAIAHPEIASVLVSAPWPEADAGPPYETLIGRLVGFVWANAPVERRLPASTDESLIAGIVGLVGDHLRVGRLERLSSLRPDLVLLILLPYLGFVEARQWANAADGMPASS